MGAGSGGGRTVWWWEPSARDESSSAVHKALDALFLPHNFCEDKCEVACHNTTRTNMATYK